MGYTTDIAKARSKIKIKQCSVSKLEKGDYVPASFGPFIPLNFLQSFPFACDLQRITYTSGPNGRGLYCCEDGINPFAEVSAACLGFVTGSANLIGFANSSHGS